MNTPTRHQPFAELPLEARALFFIYASAALARYQSHASTTRELFPELENHLEHQPVGPEGSGRSVPDDPLSGAAPRSVSLRRRNHPRQEKQIPVQKGVQVNTGYQKLSQTERRKLVTLGLRAGKSNRAIAKELNFDEGTVRRDRKFIDTPEHLRPLRRSGRRNRRRSSQPTIATRPPASSSICSVCSRR